MKYFKPHSEKQAKVIFSEKRFVILGCGIQFGKALSHDTKVLTTKGYKKAGLIDCNDILIDRNGDQTEITGIYPQGIRDCYETITTHGKSFVTDEEHLNVIISRAGRPERIETTKDLFEKKFLWGKAQIPSVQPIKFNEKNYIISPYVMGVLLGDGCLRYGSWISNPDEEVLERVRQEIPPDMELAHKEKYDYLIKHRELKHDDGGHGYNRFCRELKRLGLFGSYSNSKFIPDVYKLGSIQQRLDLLRGLMDTDGTVQSPVRSKMEYYTVSKKLCDDIIYLIESLGGKAWFTPKKTKYTYKGEKKDGQLCYRVNVILHSFNPFYLKRKADKAFKHENTQNKIIKELRFVGKMPTVCFSVASKTKTFVIENQIVTHNTLAGVVWLKTMIHQYTDPSDNFLVCSPTYKILGQSTLPPFLAIMGDTGHLDKKDMVFKIYGGGRVYFRTNQNPDSPVGITNVRAVLCDEAGLFSRYFFNNIQARASFKEAPIRIVTSPYSLNWLYQDFIRPYKKGDEFIHSIADVVQATSKENPYFPDDEYEQRRRTMEPRRFNMIYGGNFDKADGLVYQIFDIDKHVIPAKDFEPGTKFYGGIDWGYTDPFVAKIRAVSPHGFHYDIAEFYKRGLTLEQMLDGVRQMIITLDIKVERWVADPSRPDYINEFCRAGISTIAANNEIRMGIDRHYELIAEGKYYIFEKTCPQTVEEYELYHYPEIKDLKPDQTQKDELPVDKDNHTMDVSRYLTLACYMPRGKRKNRIHTHSEYEKHVTKPVFYDSEVEKLKQPKKRNTNNWI